jgi:hypothetical protein
MPGDRVVELMRYGCPLDAAHTMSPVGLRHPLLNELHPGDIIT